MSKKGFTLIELLVVVAIIGLISSIVLVNTRGSQSKARDANIESMMHQVRNAAEMSYLQSESYAQVCDEANNTLNNAGDFGILENAIKKENGQKALSCYESTDKKSFAVSTPLVGAAGKHWCVESAGLSIALDQAITSFICQ